MALRVVVKEPGKLAMVRVVEKNVVYFTLWAIALIPGGWMG